MTLDELKAAPSGRPFLFNVMRDVALENGDANGVKYAEASRELWERAPEEWEIERTPRLRPGMWSVCLFKVTQEAVARAMSHGGQDAVESIVGPLRQRAVAMLVAEGLEDIRIEGPRRLPFSDDLEYRAIGRMLGGNQ